MASSAKSGMIRVMIANVINLAIGLINGFIMPKYLSIETYAVLKEYLLYISYAGFFHLGYMDGMYLKYGGAELKKLVSEDLGSEFKNTLLFQAVIMVSCIAISLLVGSPIILFFAFGVFLKNVSSFFQMLFQAVGEFSLYSKTLNYSPIALVILNLILLFIVGTDNYTIYLAAQVVPSFFVVTYLGYLLNKRVPFVKYGRINWCYFRENISSGFVLMLGNSSNIFFANIGKWYVKILLSTTAFAVFSFAASMDLLVTVFITPIAITLYNSFCHDLSDKYVSRIKDYVLIWAMLVITAAFPAKWIVEHYLTKYTEAIDIIFIFLATQVFYAVIKGIYVNLYKAQKRQKHYFKQMIIISVTAIALDGLMYLIFRNLISIAAGSLLTAVVWLILCEREYKNICFNSKQWLAVGIILCSFFACGQMLPTVLGLIAYLGILAATLLLLMRKPLFELANIGIDMIKSKLHIKK